MLDQISDQSHMVEYDHLMEYMLQQVIVRGVIIISVCREIVNESRKGVCHHRWSNVTTAMTYRVHVDVDSLSRVWPHNSVFSNEDSK